MTNKGNLIVFEGIDNCGKTSQIEKVYQRMLDAGEKVIIINNIDEDGITGKTIRKLLVDGKELLDNMRIALLYLSELVYINKKEFGVEHYLNLGYTVLCSRYAYSTHAYVGTTPEVKKVIADVKNYLAKPDMVIYLKISLDTAKERMTTEADFFECMDKLSKVKERYEEMISDGIIDNILIINGEVDFDRTNNTIYDIINILIKNGDEK